MLTSWRLSRFKSVIDETTLPLASLTIFTGANSAGKSTVIQSMLLTTQSLQSSNPDRPVVLNGHIARLGSFKDLVSSANTKEKITIGFKISLPRGSAIRTPRRRQWNQGIGLLRGVTIDTVDVSYTFSADPGATELHENLLDLQPALEHATVSVTFPTETGQKSDSIKVARSKETLGQRLTQLRLEKSDLLPQNLESLKYKIEIAPSKGYSPLLTNIDISSTPAGAVMHHFLPRALTKRIDLIEARTESQFTLLTRRGTYISPYVRDLAFQIVPEHAIKKIFTLLEPLINGSEATLAPHNIKRLTAALEGLAKNKTLQVYEEQTRYLAGPDASKISSKLEEHRPQLIDALRAECEPKYNLDTQYSGEQISEGMDLVQNFFANNVQYLGPLRDEPKPLYPLAGTTDPLDVGLRGEHTAAVLHAHKNTTISFIPCAYFADNRTDVSGSVEIELASAVNDWLNYMGVGRNFSTFDSGKLGHELKITTSGTNLEHDLTQVGVGVSQLLPILVLALLAPPESTLIFEQPELHLHPKIQSRLADFFFSMTLLGKQCIVETHSEYLINRLRYLSASEKESKVADNTVIYFVEKPADKSLYRQIRIDDLGSLDSWPEGFFDESERSTTALLRRSLEKRKSRQGNKDAAGYTS